MKIKMKINMSLDLSAWWNVERQTRIGTTIRVFESHQLLE